MKSVCVAAINDAQDLLLHQEQLPAELLEVIISVLVSLVSAVMSMYTGAKTVVRTVYGNSSCFEVNVGMYQ